MIISSILLIVLKYNSKLKPLEKQGVELYLERMKGTSRPPYIR